VVLDVGHLHADML